MSLLSKDQIASLQPEYKDKPRLVVTGLIIVVVFLLGVWIGMVTNTMLYHRHQLPVHTYQYQYDKKTYDSIPQILDELNRKKNPDPDK